MTQAESARSFAIETMDCWFGNGRRRPWLTWSCRVRIGADLRRVLARTGSGIIPSSVTAAGWFAPWSGPWDWRFLMPALFREQGGCFRQLLDPSRRHIRIEQRD